MQSIVSKRHTTHGARPSDGRTFPVQACIATVLAITFAACAPLPPVRTEAPTPQVTALPVTPRPSANFDERRPNFVVIHHTSNDDIEHSIDVLTGPKPGVSAHYLIGRDGRIYHLVDEGRRAWHAGESYWGGQRDMNSASIGIELDNNGKEPFAELQIVSLLALLGDLKSRYKIPAANFVGHGDIAPGRKVDPSALFPWQRMAEQGFGVWCAPPYPAVPADLDTSTMLQAFGYNVWNLEAAVAAFKRRFAPDDPSPGMTERDRSMLYCLLLQLRQLATE